MTESRAGGLRKAVIFFLFSTLPDFLSPPLWVGLLIAYLEPHRVAHARRRSAHHASAHARACAAISSAFNARRARERARARRRAGSRPPSGSIRSMTSRAPASAGTRGLPVANRRSASRSRASRRSTAVQNGSKGARAVARPRRTRRKRARHVVRDAARLLCALRSPRERVGERARAFAARAASAEQRGELGGPQQRARAAGSTAPKPRARLASSPSSAARARVRDARRST